MDIVSFRHKGLCHFFETGQSRGLSRDRIKKRRQILMAINSAQTLDELETMPGWRLHELQGKRVGTFSIVVTGNFRLTFTLKDEQVHDVDFKDYH